MGHKILLVGPPIRVKSMLAKRIPTFSPPWPEGFSFPIWPRGRKKTNAMGNIRLNLIKPIWLIMDLDIPRGNRKENYI